MSDSTLNKMISENLSKVNILWDSETGEILHRAAVEEEARR